jgi:predicted dehydrogenase
MTSPASQPERVGSSRRQFLATSSAVAAGAALTTGLTFDRSAHAGVDDTLKIGLIGCGGRGSGAAKNALLADANCKLTALGDVFPDRLTQGLNNLKGDGEIADKVAVTDEHCYTGFDAYKGVLQSGVDVVILATPPHFRPLHLRAAVEAGKHIFCEKPVAVDAPGVRSVLETAELARQKRLNLVSGLCWRYDLGVRETMKRIKDGAIGDVVSMQSNYLAGPLWSFERQPGWSDMEYQMRNWMYYTWLSGDHIVEQFVHTLDKALWTMGDEPPVSCIGLGGRQQRTERPKWGQIYDHHSVIYEYPNDVRVFAFARQMAGTANDNEHYIFGTKGKASVLKNSIKGETNWRYKGNKPSMYDVEHQELFAAIRKGETINNGVYMARSTMMAILGRDACYTGKELNWDESLASNLDLSPPSYDWIALPTPPVPIPGIAQTQLASRA